MMFLLLLPFVATLATAWDQSIAVKGRFLCGTEPANAQLKLLDEDGSLDPDDLLDTKDTDGSGYFSLSGTTEENSLIEPKSEIEHRCNEERETATRRMMLYLPQSYITDGRTPTKTFDIGVLNLETIFPGERDYVLSFLFG
ncbi:hypothetical protein KIN20_004928 [Parelaphostrongylus tenuis]|uniref:Transthyretin-like family protein n=1 Tax=Parelaphostrongylus tenuis TaxID=148309 RepID=A0AAD5MI27_PARTN|nr:hypothetical protein KIN20_004928 [Parelaphostrongylus tenuis]